ncbi:MAG: hypothetical protein JW870_12735 [Candidatus Delongbacteria bacterium]|nr:hypothetical protein [Candidatus Delongbacteria bacterium]
MIDFKLKYQATIFLNANDIGATQKNISDLMMDFSDKGFIPNIFQEITNLNPQPQNRFRLQASNSEWIINIGSLRIDIEKNPIDMKGANLGGELDFCKDVTDFFARILKRFPRKASRLAFVSRFLLDEMSKEQLEGAYNKLFNSPNIYTQNKPFEWNWRTAARIEKEICDKKEEFNFVTTVNRVNGEIKNGNQLSLLDRIEFNFDINSIPFNSESRFGNEEIKYFFDNVYTWHEDIKNEMANFLK